VTDRSIQLPKKIVQYVLGAITFEARDIDDQDKKAAQGIRGLEPFIFKPARKLAALPREFAHLFPKVVQVPKFPEIPILPVRLA
jgi:hypothetical protein